VDDPAGNDRGVIQLGTTGASTAEEYQAAGQVGEAEMFDTITEDAFAAGTNQVDGRRDKPAGFGRTGPTRATAARDRADIPHRRAVRNSLPTDSEPVEPTNQAPEQIKQDGHIRDLRE